MSKSEVWEQVHQAYDSGKGKETAWDDVHRFYGGIATSIKLRQRGVSLAKLKQVESETAQRNRDRAALSQLRAVERDVAERNKKRKIESEAKAAGASKKPVSMISASKKPGSTWKKGQKHTVSNKKQLDELINKMVEVGELDQKMAELLRKKDFNFTFYDYVIRKTPKTIQLEKVDRLGKALDKDIEEALGDRYKKY